MNDEKEKVSGMTIKTAGNKTNVQRVTDVLGDPKPRVFVEKPVVKLVAPPAVPVEKPIVTAEKPAPPKTERMTIGLWYSGEGKEAKKALITDTIESALNGTDLQAKLTAIKMLETLRGIIRK